MKSAGDVSVAEVLGYLDSSHKSFADGVASGAYAFWLGSGISRDRVDDLSKVVIRVIEFLRTRIQPADANCSFKKAFYEAIAMARLSPSDAAQVNPSEPLGQWACKTTLISNLTSEYSELLDIRVDNQAEEDFLLWNGVNVAGTYGGGLAPDSEHICIAILVLEGIAPELVSANWDGLIEQAIAQLAADPHGVLKVCVTAEDVRVPNRRSTLTKFHGCAIRAAQDEATYRPFLVARYSQITGWSANDGFRVIREYMSGLATRMPTLMIGMTAQDDNIQHVFATGQNNLRWPWPSNPPAQVFTEDELGVRQKSLLKVVYKDAYNSHRNDIEAGALLRAYAKPALLALVLYVLTAKADSYVQTLASATLPPNELSRLSVGLRHLRNKWSTRAEPDRLAFCNQFVSALARAAGIARRGETATSSTYSPLSLMPTGQTKGDPSLDSSGMRELFASLALLGLGEVNAAWEVVAPSSPAVTGGTLSVRKGTTTHRIFMCANQDVKAKLLAGGAIKYDDKDVVLVQSFTPPKSLPRNPSGKIGRTGMARLREVVMSDVISSANSSIELVNSFRLSACL